MVLANNINFNLDLGFLKALSKFKGNTLSFFELLKVVKKLYLFESFAKDIKVTKENLEQTEDSLIAIDDLIDELKEAKDRSSFLEKMLLDKAITLLLNINFIISNKVADIYYEDS
jgi:hypothetical protein